MFPAPVFDQDLSDGSWDIDICVQAAGSVAITVTGRSGAEIRLDQIRIEPNVGLDVILNVDSSLTAPIVEFREAFFTDLPLGGSTISGDLHLGTIDIDKTSSDTLGYMGISGGSFVCERISVIEVDGDILSSLTSFGTGASHVVNSIRCAGSLLGDITIGGNCNGLLVGWEQGGGTSNIGTSSQAVSIDVGGELVSITADNIYANVEVGGNLRSFRVEGSWDSSPMGSGSPTGDGVFSGSLVCDTISGGAAEVLFSIFGDLDAHVTIEDELATGKRMAIAGDLTSTGSITFTQSDGLKGDITIGYLPAIDADWDGNITLGATTLSPTPFYTQVPTSGGQVGNAPHGLHRQACNPA